MMSINNCRHISGGLIPTYILYAQLKLPSLTVREKRKREEEQERKGKSGRRGSRGEKKEVAIYGDT